MGYINHNTGYIKDLLSNRSIIKRGNYALIEPDGLVKNTLPGFERCEITILATPKLGASFVDYLINMLEGGKNLAGFGGDAHIETFVYVIDGNITANAEGQDYRLESGGYLYCPPGVSMTLENANGSRNSRLFLYKKRYTSVTGFQPHVVCNNVHQLEKIHYEGMSDVIVQDLLPANLGFDMNIHILTFAPGACHGYVETHVQEHGALILSGEGMYNLDNHWIPVKKNDYIFMGAYCPQACYAVGRDEPLSYIYSKDCNRDVEL